MKKLCLHFLVTILSVMYEIQVYSGSETLNLKAMRTYKAKTSFSEHSDVSDPLNTLHNRSYSGNRTISFRPPSVPFLYKLNRDPVIQDFFPNTASLEPILNFEGMGLGFTGPSGVFQMVAAPPDTDGAVGPHHYFQQVNTSVAIFNKSGFPIYGPETSNTVWKGFGGQCEYSNDGGGSVYYDQIADRWIVSQFVIDWKVYLECVAVSTSGDPTGTYNRYSFRFKPLLPKESRFLLECKIPQSSNRSSYGVVPTE